VIVDFFGGSGSTLFAAHKLERVCYLLELDPCWCDVIRKTLGESEDEKK